MNDLIDFFKKIILFPFYCLLLVISCAGILICIALIVFITQIDNLFGTRNSFNIASAQEFPKSVEKDEYWEKFKMFAYNVDKIVLYHAEQIKIKV